VTTHGTIRLENVGKTYPGTSVAAVEELSLEVPDGEILVLVGPSGCGKSTTLRLINRMIEPSAGRIYLDDEDVTDVNADDLRRRIGYVIQQIGLFPHRSIASNIATVPRLLGWDKKRITSRVDELLEMVGLDPSQYRDRYPKELSGGQAQRVGVARALGADPEIMLMDEPFGAIDPITRDRLQNEFLRLQDELKKTIVFVTHDISEAIKMGDRIAILGDRSVIKQIDTPERILSFPADDFVDDFIGSGSTIKGLSFQTVGSLELRDYPTIGHQDSADAALEVLRSNDSEWCLVVDEQHRPQRWLNEQDLREANGSYDTSGTEVQAFVAPDATLHDTLEQMLASSSGSCCVVDKSGSLQGVVEMSHLNGAIYKARQEAMEQQKKIQR